MPAATPELEAIPSDAEAERQARALTEAAEIGLELARALRDEVLSRAEGPFRNTDPALAYSRITRAIRLTIALQARLRDERLQGAGAAVEAGASPVEGDADEAEVEPTTETERSEPPERESLRETVREDLAETALLRRPSAEIYAVICRDLGLTPEPALFPGGAPDNDNRPDGPAPAETSSTSVPPASRAASPRVTTGGGRAALLQSACAAPMSAAGPLLPWPRRHPPP